MHLSVVNFDTPVNMVGGDWAQRRGSSFLIRRWDNHWSDVTEVKTAE